jgi:hypothetical protein
LVALTRTCIDCTIDWPEKVRQSYDCPREVIKPTMGIAGGEFWLRVTRKLLKLSQVDSGPAAEG